MAKKISSEDTINDSTLHQLLLDINARLGHLEDIEADNRDLIVKVIKQGNSIVQFLKDLEIEEVPMDYEPINSNLPSLDKNIFSEKVQELLERFLKKDKELKELEEELKKHKDKLTPGQVGES